MGEVHQLILGLGEDRARQETRPELVDAAKAVLSDDDGALGITYSGFALTSLPHRKLPDDQPWERRGHKLRLLVEPGRLPAPGGGYRLYGVPYGARARMILLYLQTRAIQTDNREVELGRSMHEWLDRMGLSAGGKTYRDIRDQAARISACTLIFVRDGEGGSAVAWERDSIVKGGISFASGDGSQRSLWEDRVLLSERFFEELKAHPVPLAEAALRAINNNSASIDIYIWLAYRLWSLNKSTQVTWQALHDQFGAGYARLRDFRKRFVEALELALAVYPEAQVKVDEVGVMLHPSRPPIPERKIHQIR